MFGCVFVLSRNSPLLPPLVYCDLKSVHANGDAYDKAARDTGDRAGILRRDIDVLHCVGANAVACRKAARRARAVQAAMRHLPHHQCLRAATAGSAVRQDRRQAGRQSERIPLFAGVRHSHIFYLWVFSL